MKEIKSNLKAGIEVSFTITGRYFRLIEAGGDVVVNVPDLNIKTNYRVGVGVELGQFKEIRITSSIDQEVIFVVSNEKVDDQRVITVEKAGTSYSAPSAVSLSAGVAKEILTADAERFKASLQADADMYVGSDATVTTSNGIKIAAGSLVEIKNKAALWCISASDTSVRVLREFV